MWPVEAIVKGTKGTAYRVEKGEFTAISTDSRTIGPGEFFIPLKGPNFDGHGFIASAYEKSGGGSLCDRSRTDIQDGSSGTLILVDDTNQALLDLARYKRRQTPGTFIAITGSNGKTTTKELLVHVAGGAFRLASNAKNYNNQIGVAKTILAIEDDPQFTVLEMGTNHPGEIAVLARMVEPHISLITNVNPSHLEGLSDLEGVKREKLSLFDATARGGTVIINADDPSISSYKPKTERRALTFGIRERADVGLKVIEDKGLEGFDISLTFPGGELTTSTRLVGRHNLYDVLAAAAIAHEMGVAPELMKERIASFDAYKGRFKPTKSSKGFIVVDDAYNANPTSMRWAINTVLGLPSKGRKIAVLGEMRELGERSETYHRDLACYLRDSSMSLILLLGEGMKVVPEVIGNGRVKHFENRDDLIDFLVGQLRRDDIVLVKGSRALGMDKIVEAVL
jgi:UDP-N-acetylmuramoyl-tripeptide--D-alanyl-D-alanine ligase